MREFRRGRSLDAFCAVFMLVSVGVWLFPAVAGAQPETDWPNLAKYRDQNAKLGSPRSGENRVVFMGDSITEGWRFGDGGFFVGKPYVNRGISGQTTPQMLIRFRPDVIALKPKVVVILAGTNDIAGNTAMTLEMTEDNISSMADLARANGIRVVLSSVLPAYDFPWRRGLKPYEKISILNDWIRGYAAKNGMPYVDYYSAMADARPGLKSELSGDGVHPNTDGYAIMAPLVEKAIAQALQSK